MKRRFYFWLEKLQIPPEERVAISVLMLLLMLLVCLNWWLQPAPNYSEAHYRELEEAFYTRSQMADGIVNGEVDPPSASDRESTEPDSDAGFKKNSSLSNNLDKLSTHESAGGKPVDINKANAEQLESLPGIGPVYAERIIRYRRKHGPFTTAEQLLEIKGIGKKRLDKLKPFIKVNH
ncbi:MAG: helix-hairpin-helix domain-containing protein [Balneolaceae bacterium]|nr:helix-hairpin-helix domain-containing protein [Balneolaceae bacterium]